MIISEPRPWEPELLHTDAEVRHTAREHAMLEILKPMFDHDIRCEQSCSVAAAKPEANES